MVDVKIEGLDAVRKKLTFAEKNFKNEADKIIEDGGEKIFAHSQNIVPVLTGTLQISGNHNHTFLKSEIGYNTDYARAVEEGTSKQRPKPYLRPAVLLYSGEIEKNLAELLPKLI